MKLAHYQLIREIQIEKKERYQASKEQQARTERDEVDAEYNGKRELMIREQNQANSEMSRHETVLSEIKTLKRQVK